MTRLRKCYGGQATAKGKGQTTKARAIGLCLLSVVLGPILLALAAEPSALVGAVAQRYPWNGMVDVTCKVKDAPKGAQLVVKANGAEVARCTATNGEQKVSFDASKVEALKGRQMKDVKVTAEIVGK